MEFVKIVLVSIVAAVLYGVAHDMVTAHVCVEYFTIGHPPVFRTESPTLLALGWGVIATWWMGLALGLMVGVAARAGTRPALGAADLLRPVGLVLACMAALSLAAGLVGYRLAAAGVVRLFDPFASAIPKGRHTAFVADLWAHNAAYLAGALGGITLCLLVWRRRGKLSDPAAGRTGAST